jgi:hypothetical protein
MEWIEVIILRLANPSEVHKVDAICQAIAMDTTLHGVKWYHHPTDPGDLVVQLVHQGIPAAMSDHGQRIVGVFNEWGLVHHAVWVLRDPTALHHTNR